MRSQPLGSSALCLRPREAAALRGLLPPLPVVTAVECRREAGGRSEIMRIFLLGWEDVQHSSQRLKWCMCSRCYCLLWGVRTEG